MYASRAQAWKRADPWVEDLLQIDDANRREAALRQIGEALGGADPDAIEAALIALGRTGDVRFDRSRFRPMVMPHLKAPMPSVRLAALGALLKTNATGDDVHAVLALAADPASEVRTLVPNAISVLTDGDLTGAPGEALLKLLNDPDFDLVVDAMRGLGGATNLPPAVVDRLLDIGADREKRGAVLHFALMNMPKSKKVIDALFGYIDDGTNLSSVGVCLQRGIPAELKGYLCKEVLERLEKSEDDWMQYEYLNILWFNADEQHRDAIQRLIDERVIRPRNEEQARGIVKHLR